jgi:glutathione S-transferase
MGEKLPNLELIQYGGLTRGTTMSPPCGKVQMALHFKGLPFHVRNVGGPRQARAFNPRGRVPALRIGSEMVVDSTDILDALEARFPQPALDPIDPHDRALARLWEDWADECLYFYGVWVRFGVPENFDRVAALIFRRMPTPLRPIGKFFLRRMMRARLHGQGVGDKEPEAVWRELATALDLLEECLVHGPFLVGGVISRADLAVCALLDQGDVHELTPQSAQLVRARPRIGAWRAAVHARCGNAARGGCGANP